ncbi:hypothetical protein MKZ38_006989 [Zalerion maritima]|uniref:Zn(2)-C6 fungal-type domain-containing protein n=1 Tax=Zalerion maritima TaxID=339359 RepID=A0AAD5WPH3_9PEZI|nr:hypothetical protein MKZ38_006989 [Zalerion maritima]
MYETFAITAIPCSGNITSTDPESLVSEMEPTTQDQLEDKRSKASSGSHTMDGNEDALDELGSYYGPHKSPSTMTGTSTGIAPLDLPWPFPEQEFVALSSTSTSNVGRQDGFSRQSVSTSVTDPHLLAAPTVNLDYGARDFEALLGLQSSSALDAIWNEAWDPLRSTTTPYPSSLFVDDADSSLHTTAERDNVPATHYQPVPPGVEHGAKRLPELPRERRHSRQTFANGASAKGISRQSRSATKVKKLDSRESKKKSTRQSQVLNDRLALSRKPGAATTSYLSLPRGRPSERGFSCVRCTIRHKKCTGVDDVCDNCSSSKLYRQLCLRASFKDLRSTQRHLYCTRIQSLMENISESTTLSYSNTVADPSPAPVTIQISSGFPCLLELELVPYHPIDSNKLIHTVFRGLEGGTVAPKVNSTAFRIKEGSLSTDKIDRYCDSLVLDMIQHDALREVQVGENMFVRHIMMFAANQSTDGMALGSNSEMQGMGLVRLCLRFLAIQALFFRCPWTIVSGAFQVRMSPMLIPGHWHGKTLLPRLVNQELDRKFETRMNELEAEILSQLESAIYQSHRESWCTIFLSSFLLLHALEQDSWNMRAWEYETNPSAGRAGGWPLGTPPGDFCDQNSHIARAISTHFRVVTKGHTAFTLDWEKESSRKLLADIPAASNLVKSIQKDLKSPTSLYSRELKQTRSFSRDDIESLNYTYTKSLIFEREG